MAKEIPCSLTHQELALADPEMSASKMNSGQTSPHREAGLPPMDLSPTTTFTAKEQSGPMEASGPVVLDPHQIRSPPAAATSSLSARHPVPATGPSMPLSSLTPTPSVPSRTEQATSPQGLGLSQETLRRFESALASEHDLSQPSMTTSHKLGNLHKRRAEALPEKFNTGHLEPLQPQALLSAKKIRTEDGTPRDVVVKHPTPQRTLLTAILSNFNLTPSASVNFPGSVGIPTIPAAGYETNSTPSSQLISSSQLTAGLDALGFATPKAYTIPLSAIEPTPNAKPKPKHTRPFSLLLSFCANNELFLLLTSYLNIPSLISLYSVSKVYHHQFNCHYTAHILAIMRTWAPHSELIFPWRDYRDLCIKDPVLRQNSRLRDQGSKAPYGDLRYVPSLRWLQMVVYRHGVCTDMLLRLASYGHRCPPGTLDALKVSPIRSRTPPRSQLTPLPARLVPT
jgi:hypothetical protein